METTHQHNPEILSEKVTSPEFTPEKLAIMKLKDSAQLGRDFLSEPTTPTGLRKSFDFPHSLELSRSSLGRARSSRQISTSTRRGSSFMHSHRDKMSMELTHQAETKFFALMDLMSSASREASSLKEFWSRIIRERESLSQEREDLLLQIDEVTETLEREESERHNHGYELVQKKAQVEKLLLELSAALNTVSEQKKKVSERDHELARTRYELHDLRETVSQSNSHHEKLKTEFEAIELKLRTCEEERDHSRRNAGKYHDELRTLTREHTELKSKSIEITSRLETSRKEVLSLTDRIKIWEMEREEHLHEKDRLQEQLRKANTKAEQASLELFEVTEKYERQQREVHKLKETIREVESERDEQSHTIEHLRRELKAKSTAADEVEERCADISLKYEHIKREVITIKEKLRDVELERNELREHIEKSREDYRLIIIERDQFKDDLDNEYRKSADSHRSVTVLQDTLRKTESTLTEVRSEIHTLTDRIKHADRERNDFRDKNGHLHTEITELKEKLVVFQGEIRTITESRDRIREELHDYKHKYEDITETITEYRDNSGGLEFEIENLRSMLREAREQKERAITARNAADRERDDYIAKYEEKCREMERFEQSAASHYHSHSHGRSSSSRVVSRSNTVVHNVNGTSRSGEGRPTSVLE